MKTTEDGSAKKTSPGFKPWNKLVNIQTLNWYDKLSISGNEPELEFWDKIPTTRDETKVLQGKPGELITTARKSGNDLFVGTITNNENRIVKFSFDFLPKGKNILQVFIVIMMLCKQ